jgi:copper chaperone
MKTIQLNIEGMSCGHCKKHVQEAFSAKNGVSEVIVSLEEGSAKISFDESKSTESEIESALENSVYSIVS